DPFINLPNRPSGPDSGLNGTVVGLAVAGAAAAYIGIAILVIRRYRKRKLRELERIEYEQRTMALQRSISGPINVEGSSPYGWQWHYES
ncbi:hypothetical protein BGW38_008648, partial [Lunasporangiospora selenospora]